MRRSTQARPALAPPALVPDHDSGPPREPDPTREPVRIVSERPDDNPFLAIGLKVTSTLAFTLMSALIKGLGAAFPTGEVVFFRSAFALLPVLGWLWWRGHFLAEVRTDNLRGHITRGLIGSAGMFCGFTALAHLPLSDAVALGYAAPLITVVLAAILLRETVRIYRWSAVAVGFVGVLVMLSPHFDPSGFGTGDHAVGAIFGLLGACCAAGATIQVRRLTGTENTGAIVLYFSLLTTVLGLATIVFGWAMPSWAELGGFALAGILGGIGQILLTQSYRHADTSLVAPFDYTTMIWALLIGWFVFAQVPGPAIIVGGSVVAGAGIFVIWREHRLGLRRAKHVEAGAQRSV